MKDSIPAGLRKYQAEAERLGKQSFAFAFFIDRQKEQRKSAKEFYTEKWHYTTCDTTGHCEAIKNMNTGASQTDVNSGNMYISKSAAEATGGPHGTFGPLLEFGRRPRYPRR